MTFLKQLKERRLFKIVFAYLAAAWVVLEVVSQVTEQGVLPGAVYQVVLIWALCGIPGALIVGWYHGEKGKQRATRTEVGLLIGIVLLALTASAGTVSDEMSRRLRMEAAAQSDMDLRRIAVLYFDDLTAGGEAQHLADGLTESLIDELATVRELDVISRNGVAPFHGSDLPFDSIARILQAGTVVAGSIEQVAGDRVRLSVRLMDGQSGAVFSRSGFDRPTGDLLSARDELARQAALLLRDWLGEQIDLRRTRRQTESVPAWALYQRAEKARKDAERALEHADVHSAEEAFDRADQLLTQAELVDAQWSQPSVLRGRIAYRRARLAATVDPHESVDWIRAGLGHVERALAVSPNQADALEVRGTLMWLHHLLGVEADPQANQALADGARRDLERAVSLDPRLSSAHAILSHLYMGSDLAASVLAGRRAFEEDAYVENAPAVLARLTTGLYNLEQFTESRRWCNEGHRRFAEDHRFVVCQLMLMTTNSEPADPERAWALLARLDSLAPPYQAEWERIRGELLVGGVLARAGLQDSARAVLRRARQKTSPSIDPDRFMYSLEAHMRTLLGDDDEAIDLLTQLAAVQPHADFESEWWWRSLRGHPRFQELLTLTTAHAHH
jgi:TolB-like protein